jgi:hypothetical protein
MKKASFIIVISLVTVFLTGHYFIYKSVLKSHKKEFKAFIRSNFVKSEQLEINPSQLYSDNVGMKWLDENKEVCLNGVMYDILSIQNAGTKVILHVVKDKDEKELMDCYRDQFNTIYENGNTGKKNNNILKDLLSMKYFQRSYSAISLLTSEYNYSTSLTSALSSVYLSVQTPPPQV